MHQRESLAANGGWGNLRVEPPPCAAASNLETPERFAWLYTRLLCSHGQTQALVLDRAAVLQSQFLAMAPMELGPQTMEPPCSAGDCSRCVHPEIQRKDRDGLKSRQRVRERKEKAGHNTLFNLGGDSCRHLQNSRSTT
ncbi:hypothetical protein P7K49_008229 [Saguinus oedipus]|uniref:Uncharacterized protein n=1 Tax=Saguinus oedipus TaxID=9490 RepID=A0ABQ9VZG9_SAGOE|nr:hypothetical protein P7K49_008229 [Saguinus oedipus]